MGIAKNWLRDMFKHYFTPAPIPGIDTEAAKPAIDRFVVDAVASWERGEIEGVFCYMDNQRCLAFVWEVQSELVEMGKFEEALIDAYSRCRENLSHFPKTDIESLFRRANRKRLRACGSPLPDQQRFTLYRGVSGNGRKRRERGLSWTGDIDIACWFATRYEYDDPAVFTLTCTPRKILCYLAGSGDDDTPGRGEDEFILIPGKITRVDMRSADMLAGAERVNACRGKF